MSDVRFNETFDRLCKDSQEIMEAALSKIDADPEASVVICMGVFTHPEMTDRECRNRDPQFYFCWKGDEPTDDMKEDLRERCLDATDEWEQSGNPDSGLIMSIEDDGDYYALAAFAMAITDPTESIDVYQEGQVAEAICDIINETVESIPLSIDPEGEERQEDPEDPDDLDDYEDPDDDETFEYDDPCGGNVRVYGNFWSGQLLLSD